MESFIEQFGLPISSCGVGLSVAMVTWTTMRIVTGPRTPVQNEFEQQRLQQVRTGSGCFRWFEPVVQERMRFYPSDNERLKRLDRCLKLGSEDIPWKSREFLATKNLEAVLCALAIFCFVGATGFVVFAAILAVMLLVMYTWLAEKSILSRADRHLKRIRLRLPFAVDQIALMIQAGADFDDSLRTVVRDNSDHPLSAELGEVLRQVSLGRPRSQALTDLRNRLDDKDVSELVFAINKGEELGTPLSAILREQADQMRLKRSQWGEKAASEAEVQMVFPGMIVMIACLLVIVAPILLPTLLTFLEL